MTTPTPRYYRLPRLGFKTKVVVFTFIFICWFTLWPLIKPLPTNRWNPPLAPRLLLIPPPSPRPPRPSASPTPRRSRVKTRTSKSRN